MRNWLMKSLAMVAALFMLAGGPFISTASAGAKIALVLDVGGRGDLSFNDMGFKGTDEAQANLGASTCGAHKWPTCQHKQRGHHGERFH